jgi:hypothetical protein
MRHVRKTWPFLSPRVEHTNGIAVFRLLSAMVFAAGCTATQASGTLPAKVAVPAADTPESSGSGEPSSEPAAAHSTAAGPATCDLVCNGARVVSHEITPDESADYYTEQAVKHANEVLDAMHDDLLACYTTRLRGSPKAHGFITVDIVIGPTGNVQNVETQGGALLGNAAMACIVDRIKRGQFDPPHRGGTMRLEVPFTLRVVAPGEPI